ncbi:MAG: hypothetical protein IKH75_01345 [Ruminococcus sp.]|nr:hypothetical protein [Ruminococcus sp.]
MVSARTQEVIGTVHSDKGFYIGDICYALCDEIYYGIWNKVHHFDDGCFEVPEKGYSFGVGSTAYGDGLYTDEEGNQYGVDAGVIGIVPLELCDKGTSGGTVVETPGDAMFYAFEGKFKFSLPGGKEINIDTGYEEDDDDEEDEYYAEMDADAEDDSAEGWD